MFDLKNQQQQQFFKSKIDRERDKGRGRVRVVVVCFKFSVFDRSQTFLDIKYQRRKVCLFAKISTD